MATSNLKKENDMPASENYGECDACGVSLTARYWTFDRLVERVDYNRPGDTPSSSATVTVLRSETLEQMCSEDCARLVAFLRLAERGLRQGECGTGPIEVCAKCGGPVDLTQSHVAYQLMDQTESRQPWLTMINPIDSEILAYVCSACDGDLMAYEIDVPESATESACPVTKAVSTIQASDTRRRER